MYLNRERLSKNEIITKNLFLNTEYRDLFFLTENFRKNKDVPSSNYYKKDKNIWGKYDLKKCNSDNCAFLVNVLQSVICDDKVSDDNAFIKKIEAVILHSVGFKINKNKELLTELSTEEILRKIEQNTKFSDDFKLVLRFSFGDNLTEEQEKRCASKEIANFKSEGKDEMLLPGSKTQKKAKNESSEENKTQEDNEDYNKLLEKYKNLENSHRNLLNKIQSALDDITMINNSSQFDEKKSHKQQINSVITKIKKEIESLKWVEAKQHLIDLYMYIDIMSEEK